jgi:type I restriction enzyme, R subunit
MSLTEQETRSRYITPALQKAGWDLYSQIREEMKITDGRIVVRGAMHSRRAPKVADYVLFYKPNVPLAIVEAKDAQQQPGSGLQQALQYARMWDVPFAASSNGKSFVFHDSTAGEGRPVEMEIPMDGFPGPEELWRRLTRFKGLSPHETAVVAEGYYEHGERRHLRYYQAVAVNRAVDAVARGQKRLLMVMATGTGKTFTAFQIIWRLRRGGLAKRVLFLVDRNVLADQAITNDFAPFGPVMTKITRRTIDKSYEVYVALYQAVHDGGDEDVQAYREFSPDFFDLIVVDECHRGSAAADSTWRSILQYFDAATQIGLTATPRETIEVSNIDYFGDPVYVYSLRTGIDDGFLAPYSVVRVALDKDLWGWHPDPGQTDVHGQQIEQKTFVQSDFESTLILTKRTELVAQKVTEYLKATDRFAKTIVFCEDIDHAERVRQALVNANADITAQESRYVVRITGDSPYGQADLDDFIDPASRLPVIATTSKLLSTGVDAQTCKVIVLDQEIQSLTEFKQMIGRGTRIREDYGKVAFTIIDFRDATRHFLDEEFDGVPEQIYEDVPAGADGGEGDGAADRPGPPDLPPDIPPGTPRVRYVVEDVEIWVVGEQVQYYRDGKLTTETLRGYTADVVHKRFASLGDFVKRWSAADRKSAVIAELAQAGVLFDALAAEVGREMDAFDLICHVAYGQPERTRAERANRVRAGDYLSKHGATAREVLSALLDKYADGGVEAIENATVLKLAPIDQIGTPAEVVQSFGGKEGYDEALDGLEREIYAQAG